MPDGAVITVDLGKHVIEWEGQRLAIEPVPEFLREIIHSGGLVAYARDKKEVKTCTGSRR